MQYLEMTIDHRNRAIDLSGVEHAMTKRFRSLGKVGRRLKLLPAAVRYIRNWPQFVFHYSLGLSPKIPYIFRNGARIQIGRGVDHVPIIEIFMRHDYGSIPHGATVLDLGANIGTFAIYAATTANNAIVFAYEPAPRDFQLLRHNIRLNRLDEQIKCFDLAIGGSNGWRNLTMEPEGRLFPRLTRDDRDNESIIQVRCTTLTEIIAANDIKFIDLLKIDCEGSEYEILFDAPCEVFARIAEIRMEYHDLGVAGCDLTRLKNFLQSRGYVIIREMPSSASEGNLWVRRYESS